MGGSISRPRSASRPRAVALRYDSGLPAPFLVAKAEGRMALRVEELARERGIPLRRDQALAELLYPMELGAYVPPRCYEALAIIFASIKSVEEA